MIRLSLALVLVAVAPLSGQTLRGRVLSTADRAPIVGAEITVADSTDDRVVATSDTAGRFVIRLPHRGSYSVSAAHVAFAAPPVSTLIVGHDEDVLIDIPMAEAAVQLQPLVVVARRRASTSLLDGYDQRLDRGVGRFITREDIDRFPRSRVTDYLAHHIPFVYIRPDPGGGTAILQRRGSRCVPKVYVDGLPIPPGDLDLFIPVEELEGMEVYLGAAEIPGEYLDRDGCGVILAWRRETDPGGRRPTFKRLLVAGGAAALIILGFVLR